MRQPAAASPRSRWPVLLSAALFLGATIALGHFLSGPIVRLAGRTGHPETLLVLGLALCFALAFVAELVGLAAIVGAFAAGLLLDPYGRSARTEAEEATLRALLQPLSSLFVPLFFVMMGMQVHVGSLLEPSTAALAAVLIVCALAGKLVCGLGVVSAGVNRIAVGISMVPRGEVGLIFAGIGASLTIGDQPIFPQALFSAVVLMVLVTTLVAPVGLRWALARGDGPSEAAGW